MWLAGSSPLRPHSAAHWARPTLPGHLGGGISALTRRGCEKPDTILSFIHGFGELSLKVQVARAGPLQPCQFLAYSTLCPGPWGWVSGHPPPNKNGTWRCLMLSELSQKKGSSLMSSTRTALEPEANSQGPEPSSCSDRAAGASPYPPPAAPPSKEAGNQVCGAPPGPMTLSEMLAGEGRARKGESSEDRYFWSDLSLWTLPATALQTALVIWVLTSSAAPATPGVSPQLFFTPGARASAQGDSL